MNGGFNGVMNPQQFVQSQNPGGGGWDALGAQQQSSASNGALSGGWGVPPSAFGDANMGAGAGGAPQPDVVDPVSLYTHWS